MNVNILKIVMRAHFRSGNLWHFMKFRHSDAPFRQKYNWQASLKNAARLLILKNTLF